MERKRKRVAEIQKLKLTEKNRRTLKKIRKGAKIRHI
jgi:hypothetical protein